MKTKRNLFSTDSMQEAERDLRNLNSRYIVGHSYTALNGYVLELRIFTSNIGVGTDEIPHDYPREFDGFPVHMEQVHEIEFL